MSDVLAERDGPVLICTLNRAENNNSITTPMFKQLYEAWSDADKDPDCRAIVTTAAGRNFCVGADSRHFENWTKMSLETVFKNEFHGRQGLPVLDAEDPEVVSLGMNRWAWLVSQIKTPMIAVVKGIAAGGGLGLALLHHFRIADETSKFTTSFVHLGLGYELGMSHFLPKLVGHQKALDMSATGRVVKTQEAFDIGLIDRIVDGNFISETAIQFAHDMAAQPPHAVQAAMNAFLSSRDQSLRAAMELEYKQQKVLWDTDDFKSRAKKLFQS